MNNEDAFEGNGKKTVIENRGMLCVQDPAKTIQKKWVVSIIDAKPQSNSLLKGYIENSRCLQLGHWCTAELYKVNEIARSISDTVLVDSRLLGDQAVRIVYLLKRLAPRLALIILDDQQNLSSFIRFAQARADGFFQIPGTRQLLEQAVQDAINGDMPLPVKLRKRLVDHLARHFAPANGQRLTQAELEVFVGLLDGKRDKEIASERHIKSGTVHSITNSLYKKMRAHSRSELVQRFLPLGETFSIVRRIEPTKQLDEQHPLA